MKKITAQTALHATERWRLNCSEQTRFQCDRTQSQRRENRRRHQEWQLNIGLGVRTLFFAMLQKREQLGLLRPEASPTQNCEPARLPSALKHLGGFKHPSSDHCVDPNQRPSEVGGASVHILTRVTKRQWRSPRAMRGNPRSDCWKMLSSDKLMLRSYHLLHHISKLQIRAG